MAPVLAHLCRLLAGGTGCIRAAGLFTQQSVGCRVTYTAVSGMQAHACPHHHDHHHVAQIGSMLSRARQLEEEASRDLERALSERSTSTSITAQGMCWQGEFFPIHLHHRNHAPYSSTACTGVVPAESCSCKHMPRNHALVTTYCLHLSVPRSICSCILSSVHTQKPLLGYSLPPVFP
jgi:hypothetical protein